MSPTTSYSHQDPLLFVMEDKLHFILKGHIKRLTLKEYEMKMEVVAKEIKI